MSPVAWLGRLGTVVALAVGCSRQPGTSSLGADCPVASCCTGVIWRGGCQPAYPPYCGGEYDSFKECEAKHPGGIRLAPGAHTTPIPPEPKPEPYADIDADEICRRVATASIPASSLPDAGEVTALRGCDAEASYYGIGAPVDFERARRCAFAERALNEGSVIGGPAILMMVYANGQGVPANFELAMRFACELGGAPIELESRLVRLRDALATHKLEGSLDVCADATSGYLTGFCAGHRERVDEVARGARRRAATSGMPAREVGELEARALAYFAARTDNEVDLSGTLRSAMSVEEETRLKDEHVATLERLHDPGFVPPTGDAAALERELGRVVSRLKTCKAIVGSAEVLYGTIARAGIAKTQRSWLRYRAAFVALAVKASPHTKPQAWQALLTEQRLKQLNELVDAGC